MAAKKPSDFGDRLRALREAQGFSRVELAERAGLHYQAIVKLEDGVNEPTWATVQALVRALRVKYEEFAADDGGVARRGKDCRLVTNGKKQKRLDAHRGTPIHFHQHPIICLP
jgi:transcriptional regulator with XRE-family HTH domain